ANEEIGADATDIFNYLTGYSNQNEFRKLIVAPVNLREKMLAMIAREAEHARNKRPAHIIAKMNSLTDVETVHALYEAARAGVSIDLIVRGVCVLRPEVAGLSENIRVISVVGRFLEHSRVFCFANGGNEETYIGSADLMQRNLDRRVEVLVPILDADLRNHLKNEILAAYLRDTTHARRLQSNGNYQKITAKNDEKSFNAQSFFIGKSI
ncbi:MAG: RNA degradosome polyphosphate kinase, partial [Pyrinomonadaceae bacterium]|nr:RNA degradosome polyphosphate kinase [Pyrinomonadaceae bacterium]